MDRPVICGIENWNGDAGTVQVARVLARAFRLPILYVNVLEPGHAAEEAEAASSLLRHAVDTSNGTIASAAIEKGHPADRLVARAEREEAAFLVVGSHGLRSSLLGSVSADVSRRAPCPVLVVPPTAILDNDWIRVGFAGGIVRFGVNHAAVPQRS